jgi:hypothetical protein
LLGLLENRTGTGAKRGKILPSLEINHMIQDVIPAFAEVLLFFWAPFCAMNILFRPFLNKLEDRTLPRIILTA